MARNRKRAKERRARRPQPVSSTQAARDEANPISHAAPDVELAEAQLALGRPDLADQEDGSEALEDPAPVVFESERAAEEEPARDGGATAPQRAGEDVDAEGDEGDQSASSGELALPTGTAAQARPGTASRLINFLQGSWRELQRVQWPDRRQVMQATGVVIGFVIIAGVFLGVADYVAGKLMDYILK